MKTLQTRILRLLEQSAALGAAAALTACATPDPAPQERTLTAKAELKEQGDDALCLPENAGATRIPSETWLEDVCGHIDEARQYAVCVAPEEDGQCAPPDKLGPKVRALMPDDFTCREQHTFRFDDKLEHVCGPVAWEGDGTCCYITHLTPRSDKIQMRIMFGRPFVVDGQARAATPRTQGGWSSEVALTTAPPESLRLEIARSWAHDGCDEHASIASFARFLMRLMERGAPRSLVLATTQAIDDEAHHAHACFSLASAYAGEPVAPGPLETRDSLEAADDAALLRDVITQGCVGETMAAAEAGWKLQVACEPAARAALTQITEEETRHAELAWAFVMWMLERRPELVGVARDALLTARPRALDRALATGGLTPREEVLAAHGVTPERVRHAIQMRAWRTIIAPAMDAMMAHVTRNATRPSAG